MNVSPAATSFWRRAITLCGALLALLAVFFVLREMIRSDVLSMVAWDSPSVWLALILSAAAYAVLSFLLAGAWLVQARALEPTTPIRAALGVYAISQALKYLPLNIFHHAGRVAMMKALGTPVSVSVAASIGETLIIAACALIIATTFGLAPNVGSILQALHLSIFPVLLILCFGAALTIVLGWRFRGRITQLFHDVSRIGRRYARGGSLAFLAYFVFLSASAALALLATEWVAADHLRLLRLETIAAVTAAWLVGFVTPGAPAGVGVREAVLLGLLSPWMGADAASLLALVHRAVAVLGDGLFALAGLAIWRTPGRHTID